MATTGLEVNDAVVTRIAHSIVDIMQAVFGTFGCCDAELRMAVMLGERKAPSRLIY